MTYNEIGSGGVEIGGGIAMHFKYTGSDQIRVGGCSNYEWVSFYRYAFAIGSTVYYKKKAMKGVFEKVVIKDVRIPRSYDPSRTPICRYCNSTLYIDTLNAYFNEEELVPYDEALELVQAYDLQRRADLEWLAFNC